MNNEKFTVTSEILQFFEKDTFSRPSVDEKNVVSKFNINIPILSEFKEIQSEKDEDGDYVLTRRREENSAEVDIYLEHSVSTEISLVGLQIWRAALLVADFIIHFRDSFKEKTVLELGSGVGLTSIVAGMFAKKVICTDLDVGNILTLIESNVKRNKKIIKADVCVLELDFFNREWPLHLKEKLEEATVIVAADVIYDNDVTEAFVETTIKILSLNPKKELFLALEKRPIEPYEIRKLLEDITEERNEEESENDSETTKSIRSYLVTWKKASPTTMKLPKLISALLQMKKVKNQEEIWLKEPPKVWKEEKVKRIYWCNNGGYVFTISDLDSVAPCYEHLMSYIRSAQSKPPFSNWTITEVPLDFPQYFNYERVGQLVMYKITN